MMASAQVVETSVNTNSPSQDYTTNPDDHSNHKIDVSKGEVGGGGGRWGDSRRNVRLTFLVEQIDMCDFPKSNCFRLNTDIFRMDLTIL